MSSDVLGVLSMFWVFPWCLGSVPMWCLGGIEGMVFSQLSWLTCPRKNGRQRKRETLLLGLYAGLIVYSI